MDSNNKGAAISDTEKPISLVSKPLSLSQKSIDTGGAGTSVTKSARSKSL
jgi:hypothetical protein